MASPDLPALSASAVRFENGRLSNDSSWFAFHTGSAKCYSQRFVDELGPPCPDENHVDANPTRTLPPAASRCSSI